MSTLHEIEELLSQEKISQQAALRLMLRAQVEMSARIDRTNTEIRETNQRLETITTAFLVFAFFYSLFVPITISDIRQHLIQALTSIP